MKIIDAVSIGVGILLTAFLLIVAAPAHSEKISQPPGLHARN